MPSAQGPSIKAMVAAYFGHLLFERVADYLRRGRAFADHPITRIKGRYLAAVRLYRSTDHLQEIHDLEAEVALRGETMPSLKVQACDFARMQQEHLDRLGDGPDRWREIERSVATAAVAFFERCQEAVKH